MLKKELRKGVPDSYMYIHICLHRIHPVGSEANCRKIGLKNVYLPLFTNITISVSVEFISLIIERFIYRIVSENRNEMHQYTVNYCDKLMIFV